MPQRISRTFQDRRALLRYLTPPYQQASPAQKTPLLDSFVEWTGYTRKYAIALLNNGEYGQQTIQRHRSPHYGPAVQQALFLTWKAAYYVCAKRLLPSLPTLVTLLEQHGHLRLTEEEHRQLLAMSVSTAERFLRTQRKPRLHGLSTTTPGPWGKAQIPVRMFSQWDDSRPGFVEMDLVAHCGDHLDGSFLYTLSLTDLATAWTECLPLPDKSADAVLAALARARTLFPFPLLGIDTDSGAEFLNPDLPEEAVSAADQYTVQAQPLPTPASGTPNNSTREREAGHRALVTIEQAIAGYVQEMHACGRDPKTLQWHQTSLGALRRYLWRQLHFTDIGSLTRACLLAWVSDLPLMLSVRTGATRTVSTVAAYARSARAFCNWLVRQGYVPETLFPQGAVPKAQRSLPQVVEPESG